MFCPECGSRNEDNVKFCTNCGKRLITANSGRPEYGYDRSGFERGGFSRGRYERDGFGRGGYGPNRFNRDGMEDEIIYTTVEPKSIAVCIVLSIFTFGIYMFFWQARLNNEINELAQDKFAPRGGMVVFLSIVTLGFYNLYWLYRMGQKCDQIRQRYANSGAVYLLLGVIALSIVSYALIQETINTVLE